MEQNQCGSGSWSDFKFKVTKSKISHVKYRYFKVETNEKQ
jgi:hypothetical protein